MMVDLPLILANDVVGLVRIFFAEARDFSKKLRFAEAIYEQCSYTIDKARVIEAASIISIWRVRLKLPGLGRLAAESLRAQQPVGQHPAVRHKLMKKIPGPLHEDVNQIMRPWVMTHHSGSAGILARKPASKAVANNDVSKI
jgi:hypothetical protein